MNMTNPTYAERLATYKLAKFRVHDRGTSTLSVTDHDELTSLLLDMKARTVAIVTAANPRGVRQSDEINAALFSRLLLAVEQTKLDFRPAEGGSQTWGLENGFALFDMDVDAAKALGREFAQDAIAYGTLHGTFEIVPCLDGN